MADTPLVTVVPPPPPQQLPPSQQQTPALAPVVGGAPPQLQQPQTARQRMSELLALVEREFDALLDENAHLRARLGIPDGTPPPSPLVALRQQLSAVPSPAPRGKLQQQQHAKLQGKTASSSALPAATSTSLLAAALSAQDTRWDVAREMGGHRDGVWEATPVGFGDAALFATASVDRSARVWHAGDGRCVLAYYGHRGSVNSVRANPQERLFCTASGDRSCHIFRLSAVAAAAAAAAASSSSAVPVADTARSWTPLLDADADEALQLQQQQQQQLDAGAAPACVRAPLLEFKAHRGVVIAADWVAGSERVASAGWDHTARLWSAATGEQVLQLAIGGGSGGERCRPTNLTTHPSAPLAVVSVTDGTFRVWDLRTKHVVLDPQQASTDACLSAVFDPVDGDAVVTCGADRHIKVWDLRSGGKSPRCDVRGAVAVGRFTLPRSRLLVVPQQDDSALVVDFNGKRVGKLHKHARSSVLTTTAWAPDECTIVTATFSGAITAWAKVAPLSSLT